MIVNFGDLFTLTVAVSSVRVLASLDCELNRDLSRFVIEQAFVQSNLDEVVHMRLPQGCGRLSGKMVRLNKSLYGLKQESRQWYAHLSRRLLTLGVLKCKAGACRFRSMEEGNVLMTIVVHVDDLLAVGEKERCESVWEGLEPDGTPVKNLG